MIINLCNLLCYSQIYADQRRHAKESELQVGDRVLLKEMTKTHKLAPNFGTDEFEITNRKGGEVIVRSEDTGKEYRRNVVHVKKIPENGINKLPLGEPKPEESTDRPKREIKKPKRFL